MPKCGRKTKTTDREQRKLIRMAKINPFQSASELLREWTISRNVSLSTVKRILKKYGLLGRVSTKKPMLTKRHLLARKTWCQNYSKWTIDDWSNVIFTDECRIELHSSRFRFVRRPINMRFGSRYTTKTVKYGGRSLMIWGAIKSDGQRMLIRCDSNINSSEYQKILREGLFPIYNSHNILVQDGASCHKSKSTLQFLEKHQVCVIEDWPAQSPDINIIENLWSRLKMHVGKENVKSLDELWMVCQREWEKIDNNYIKRLFDSVPSRIMAVLQNNGFPSKY